MTTELNEVISIRLLDKEYKIKCPPEKMSELQEAASYLDAKMRESYDGNKIINLERFFMITALNISHEYLRLKNQKKHYMDTMNERIVEIQNKIDEALAE